MKRKLLPVVCVFWIMVATAILQAGSRAGTFLYPNLPAARGGGSFSRAHPRLLLLSSEDLAFVRQAVARGDSSYWPALKELKREAEQALHQGPWSVVDKLLTPPGGDKHDYLSFGPYWWPDPRNPKAPYIRRDGKRNPQALTSDKADLTHLRDALEVLGPAYFYFRDERYARHGMKLIRTWFLDPRTRMNPNFEHAQAVPNRSPGRAAGIIESRRFLPILDAITLFRNSPHCTGADVSGVENWVRQFLHWLLESEKGRKEARSGNNHETSYVLQVAAFSMFLKENERAVDQFENSFKKRILAQVQPDGRMPRELARTKALSYSLFNLRLMLQVAFLAEKLGIDLYHARGPNGGSIRKALDFLIPYLSGKRPWPYQQIVPHNLRTLETFFVLRTAARVYNDPGYERLLREIFGEEFPRQTGNVFWPLKLQPE